MRGDLELFTTQSVLDELQRGMAARDMDLLKEISLTVRHPGEEERRKVLKAAKDTGDIGRLSETDIDLLALALTLNGVLITDDYSIQNVARVLDIRYECGVEKGIRKLFHWGYRCRGCGRTFESKENDCPICGSDIRIVRKN